MYVDKANYTDFPFPNVGTHEEGEFLDLIRGMLHPDPNQRMKLRDIIEHSIFKKFSVNQNF